MPHSICFYVTQMYACVFSHQLTSTFAYRQRTVSLWSRTGANCHTLISLDLLGGASPTSRISRFVHWRWKKCFCQLEGTFLLVQVACVIDGLAGRLCEEVVEMFCINQCNGHGECDLGFCKCDKGENNVVGRCQVSESRPPLAGWYGHDCSRKAAGLTLEPGRIPQHPWLAQVVSETVASLEPPPKPTRKRPLIYVYDLDPYFSQRMLQYRCTIFQQNIHEQPLPP